MQTKPEAVPDTAPLDRQTARLAEQQAKLDDKRKDKVKAAEAKAAADHKAALAKLAVLNVIKQGYAHARSGKRNAEAVTKLREAIAMLEKP